MLKRSQEVRKAEGGFSLVEMLVVVSILGVLASVAVIAIGGTMKESKASACKSDVATVQTASDAYYAKNSSYAADITALQSAGLLRNDPSTKTVADDGYALSYAATTGLVTASPAECAVA